MRVLSDVLSFMNQTCFFRFMFYCCVDCQLGCYTLGCSECSFSSCFYLVDTFSAVFDELILSLSEVVLLLPRFFFGNNSKS